MYKILNQLRQENKLHLEQLLTLDAHLGNLIDMTGGCERIANTHVPPLCILCQNKPYSFML